MNHTGSWHGNEIVYVIIPISRLPVLLINYSLFSKYAIFRRKTNQKKRILWIWTLLIPYRSEAYINIMYWICDHQQTPFAVKLNASFDRPNGDHFWLFIIIELCTLVLTLQTFFFFKFWFIVCACLIVFVWLNRC